MRTNRPRKYLEVYTALRRDLQSGRWKHGDRMPTEAELVETFGVSRITVARAMRDLQAAGLVKRRAGSGTFATSPGMASRQSFGLLIPDLGETDIFEPICQGMMASPLARQHALLWGSSSGVGASKKERANGDAIMPVHRTARVRGLLRTPGTDTGAERAEPANRRCPR